MLLRPTITKSDALQLALYFTKYQGEGMDDLYEILTVSDTQPVLQHTRVAIPTVFWVRSVLAQTELK